MAETQPGVDAVRAAMDAAIQIGVEKAILQSTYDRLLHAAQAVTKERDEALAELMKLRKVRGKRGPKAKSRGKG